MDEDNEQEEDGESGENDDMDLDGEGDDSEGGESDDNAAGSNGSDEATGTADDIFFNNSELEDFLEQAEMEEAGVQRGDVDEDDEEAAYNYVYGTGAVDEDEDGLDSGYSSEEDNASKNKKKNNKKQAKKSEAQEDQMDEDEDEEDEEDYGAIAKFDDFFQAPQYVKRIVSHRGSEKSRDLNR